MDKYDTNRQIEVAVSAKRLEQKTMNYIPIFLLAFLKLSSRDYMSALYGNLIGVIFMSTCLLAYAGQLNWQRIFTGRNRHMTGGKRLRIAALFVIVLVFAFIMDMSSNAITDNTLTRNDTGDGDAVYDLVLNADGLDEDYSYQLKVREEQPSDKQANELFTQAKKR